MGRLQGNSVCIYSAEITIGFTRERDMVEENVDTAITICVEVKNNGTLEKSITVQLDTVDGTAKGNYYTPPIIMYNVSLLKVCPVPIVIFIKSYWGLVITSVIRTLISILS